MPRNRGLVGLLVFSTTPAQQMSRVENPVKAIIVHALDASEVFHGCLSPVVLREIILHSRMYTGVQVECSHNAQFERLLPTRFLFNDLLAK